jgi:hypothetical protein
MCFHHQSKKQLLRPEDLLSKKSKAEGKLPSFRTISFRHQDLGTQQLPLLAACTVWLLIFFTQLAESWEVISLMQVLLMLFPH